MFFNHFNGIHVLMLCFPWIATAGKGKKNVACPGVAAELPGLMVKKEL